MIQPEDILRKAKNLYPRFLKAWLNGEEFFPRPVPARTKPGDDPAAAIRAVQRLRTAAKETIGYGYSIEWKEIDSRRHGRNRFPRRIVFENRDDLLRLIGKQDEFASFAAAVEQIRDRFPMLLPWVRSHRQVLIAAASEVPGLLSVVDYLNRHPRPGLFARELPLAIDTKFVERNRPILRDWLDVVLPPDAVRADEQHFERRYGLKYAEPHLLVRFLDPNLQRECGFPWSECSLPLHTLAGMPLQIERVVIVENKVNLLTLPPVEGAVALGGLGYGAADLRLLLWLRQAAIWYWGDLDTDGLTILSQLRALFPQTVSLMMDQDTLEQWRGALGRRRGPSATPEPVPAGLTVPERTAFETCRNEKLQIEQERLPHWYVRDVMSGAFAASPPAV